MDKYNVYGKPKSQKKKKKPLFDFFFARKPYLM